MATILFQGDSITDCGRLRDAEVGKSAQLGYGYPNLVSSRLLLADPAAQHICYNRGISGNRVVDLYARWKIDALNLRPDIISILIGVNDVWHEFSRQNGVETPRFKQIYRMLLELTKSTLPDVKLIILEPFTLLSEVVTEEFAADVRDHAQAAREVAGEFDAVFVPLQDKFDAAAQQASNAYWLVDGVHPAPAGHQMIADAWLEAAKNFF